MSKSVKNVISYALALGWMAVIFYMSAQPGDTSGDISGGISHLFMKVWNVVFFQGWNEAEVLHMATLWNYPIRKLAHMTEFAILAMLAFGAMQGILEEAKGIGTVLTRWFPMHTRYLATWFFTILYAATDEVHQLFVPDRSGNGFDVCVDAFGALVALLVIWKLIDRKR